METVTIGTRRQYTIEPLGCGKHTAAELKARGFEPAMFLAHGSRGAAHLAYRVAKTGKYVLVN